MGMGRGAAEKAEVIGREAALLLIGQAPRYPRHDRAAGKPLRLIQSIAAARQSTPMNEREVFS